jgi:hypothetical protein
MDHHPDMAAVALDQLQLTTKPPSLPKNDPTFLGIPRELRDEIYRNLVVVDRGPEFIPDPVARNNFNFSIFQLNRQIREDALKICREENIWITISLTSSSAQMTAADEKLIEMLVRRPQAMFKLSDQETLNVMSQRFLGICVGPGCGEPGKGIDRDCFGILFAFTQRAFAYLCNDLCRFRDSYKNMTLVVGDDMRMSVPEFADKVMFPLRRIFGLKKVTMRDLPPEDHRILKTMTHPVRKWPVILYILELWKSKGKDAFLAKDFAQAAYYFDCGADAFIVLSEVAKGVGLAALDIEGNDFHSLNVDLCNNLSLSINNLVESRRAGPHRRISNISLQQLDLAIHKSDNALKWPGLLDHQRKKAHYNRGIAYRNKADWEIQQPADQSDLVKAREYLEEAARDFYFAKQLMGPSERALVPSQDVNRRLGRVKTTQRHARMVSAFIDDQSNEVFQADLRLVQMWGYHMLSRLQVLRRRSPPTTN